MLACNNEQVLACNKVLACSKVLEQVHNKVLELGVGSKLLELEQVHSKVLVLEPVHSKVPALACSDELVHSEVPVLACNNDLPMAYVLACSK